MGVVVRCEIECSSDDDVGRGVDSLIITDGEGDLAKIGGWCGAGWVILGLILPLSNQHE